eukprot:9498394-Pyramimonas_sp.AAC.2
MTEGLSIHELKTCVTNVTKAYPSELDKRTRRGKRESSCFLKAGTEGQFGPSPINLSFPMLDVGRWTSRCELFPDYFSIIYFVYPGCNTISL